MSEAEQSVVIDSPNPQTAPEKPMLIEVLGSGGNVQRIVPITEFPFRIGRGYNNHLILTDDTVSADHLLIDQGETGPTVQNLSTENGTRYDKELLSGEPVVIQPGTELKLGRTPIRLVGATTQVAPARPLVKRSRLTRLCSDLRVALALLFTYLAVNIYYALQTQSLFLDSNEVIVGQLLQLAFPLALATVTGFISRLLLRHWHFPLHLSIASIFFLVQLFLNEIGDFTSYLFTSADVAGYLGMIFSVVLFSILLAWQLRGLSHLTLKRSSWIAAGIICPLYLVFLLQEIVMTPDFISQPQMHNILRPSDTRLQPTFDSIEEYRLQVENELRLGMQEELEEDG